VYQVEGFGDRRFPRVERGAGAGNSSRTRFSKSCRFSLGTAFAVDAFTAALQRLTA